MKKYSEVEKEIEKICRANEENCKKCPLYTQCIINGEFDKLIPNDGVISSEIEKAISK